MKNKLVFLKIMMLLLGIVILYYVNHTYIHATPQSIRNWILSFGWTAPALFILLYTFRPLLLFPASILSLTGGLAFGVWWGTALTIIGATMGAGLSFFAARMMGKNLARTKWTGRWSKWERKLEKHGFFYVLLLRLIPIFPFDLISYGSGLSKIRFRSFLYGTLIGIIPGTFAYNFLGSSFTKGDIKNILIALGVYFVAFAIPFLIKKIEQANR